MTVFKDYTPNWNLQTDGTTCGFWVATFALLIIFEIDPAAQANKKVLAKLGASGVRTLWKTIIINYLEDSVGLQASALQDFLGLFPEWKGFPNDSKCVGLFDFF